jgi:hypothetical protein
MWFHAQSRGSRHLSLIPYPQDDQDNSTGAIPASGIVGSLLFLVICPEINFSVGWQIAGLFLG